MSRSVNEVILIGHVGQEPEIRATAGGTRIASVSLATNHRVKDEEKTDWHRLKLFGKLVDVVEQWVKKGDKIYVRGRIEYSMSEKDGEKRYWTDIVVNDLVMLGSRGEELAAAPKAKRPDDDSDTLPF